MSPPRSHRIVRSPLEELEAKVRAVSPPPAGVGIADILLGNHGGRFMRPPASAPDAAVVPPGSWSRLERTG